MKEIDDEEFFSPRLNFTNMREMLTEEMWYCCCSIAVHVPIASVVGFLFLTIARMTSQRLVLCAFAGSFRCVAMVIPRITTQYRLLLMQNLILWTSLSIYSGSQSI